MSSLIDGGQVIEGINEDYIGEAPDVGAYEYGKDRWVAGYQNRICVSESEIKVCDEGGKSLGVWLLLPPENEVSVTVGENDVSAELLTFTPDNWMWPQMVRVSGKVRVCLAAEGLDPVTISIGLSGASVPE